MLLCHIIGVIVFFLWFGFILLGHKDTNSGKAIIGVLDATYNIIMEMIDFVIRLTPFGKVKLVFVSILVHTWRDVKSSGRTKRSHSR